VIFIHYMTIYRFDKIENMKTIFTAHIICDENEKCARHEN